MADVRLMDQVRGVIRALHYSRCTDQGISVLETKNTEEVSDPS